MTKHLLSSCLALATAIAFAGCQSLPQNQPAPQGQARVTHVVVCWLKHHGGAVERRKLIDASKSFKAIPGVVHVAVGPVLPSQRPGVDSSFDVAVAISFKDAQSLAAYGKNPLHQQALKNVLKPLASKYVIYDFVNR